MGLGAAAGDVTMFFHESLECGDNCLPSVVPHGPACRTMKIGICLFARSISVLPIIKRKSQLIAGRLGQILCLRIAFGRFGKTSNLLGRGPQYSVLHSQ
jgi:hypothetical protein